MKILHAFACKDFWKYDWLGCVLLNYLLFWQWNYFQWIFYSYSQIHQEMLENQHPNHAHNSFQQCNQHSFFHRHFHSSDNHYQSSVPKVVFQVSQNIAANNVLKSPDEGQELQLKVLEYFPAQSEKSNKKKDFNTMISMKLVIQKFLYSHNCQSGMNRAESQIFTFFIALFCGMKHPFSCLS